MEKLLTFTICDSSDGMSFKSSASLDSRSDEKFIQEGTHPYSHESSDRDWWMMLIVYWCIKRQHRVSSDIRYNKITLFSVGRNNYNLGFHN